MFNFQQFIASAARLHRFVSECSNRATSRCLDLTSGSSPARSSRRPNAISTARPSHVWRLPVHTRRQVPAQADAPVPSRPCVPVKAQVLKVTDPGARFRAPLRDGGRRDANLLRVVGRERLRDETFPPLGTMQLGKSATPRIRPPRTTPLRPFLPPHEGRGQGPILPRTSVANPTLHATWHTRIITSKPARQRSNVKT